MAPSAETPLESFHLTSLGCVRNLSDSEVAVGVLIEAGYHYAASPHEADIAVVNTCGFIQDAKQESVDAILELGRLKSEGKIRHIVVIGCMAQRYAKELRTQIPETDAVIGTDGYASLPAVFASLGSGTATAVSRISKRPHFLKNSAMSTQRLTPPHLIYLKINEGCLNRCSYCAIPDMRGQHRSRSRSDIVSEARREMESGLLREVNLIGQDTAAYGYDLKKQFMLPKLLEELAAALPGVWIRPLYMHPSHIEDRLMDVMAANDNICDYADIPIEHSHPEILRLMKRGSSREDLERLVNLFRERLPGVALRSAVIVGFPGEGESEFQDLLDFTEWARFDKLGAFKYSREEGTPAHELPGQVPEEVKSERYERLMRTQQRISAEVGQSRIGRELKVLIEEVNHEEGKAVARSEFDAPEVDGRVLIEDTAGMTVGEFTSVRVTGADVYDLKAERQDT